MGEMLTSAELAEQLSLRPSTIRRWARRGIIPTIRISQKVMRFDPVEVVQALRCRSDQLGGAR
jgi:predicted site-specific integrase-resolvase